MKYYNIDFLEATKTLKTSINNGLSDEEAKIRLEEYGANALPEGKKTSIFYKFLMQFNDFMVLVLIGAAIISAVMEVYTGGNDFIDSIVIVAIVIFNSVIGVVQECKADKAIGALKEITEPIAVVIRDGHEVETKAQALVPGDIIKFETGNLVPADCRLIEGVSLKTNESALTGETAGVDKHEDKADESSPLAERHNMLFMGTSVVQGRGKAVVTNTGKDTEIGKIAAMLDTEDNETPLQKKLSKLGKMLGIAALGICFVIFLIGVLRGLSAFDMFMTSVSLAVAAIPEGLTAVVTIVLAIGVQKMAKNNAIVKKLSAVEALGNATVICSDKTGTITENLMTLTEVIGEDKNEVIKLACLCCDSDGVKGEATELGIVRGGEKHGILKHELEVEMPRVFEIPFTSERKRMTTVHKYKNEFVAVSKGACEYVLKGCKKYLGKNGVEDITNDVYTEIINSDISLAEKGLRVLAVAKKVSTSIIKDEEEFIFCGLIALRDNPRKGVKKSIKIASDAGIRTVMITGDSPVTAKAIGTNIGINSNTITGNQIDSMNEEEFNLAVDECNIFARVTPEHKYRIVKRLKDKGEIVAFAGDGINDAPSIKLADIGCAMGKNGTEVARQAADIVLADDNFNTIVKAVEEGKGIYENILKVIHFLLSSNIGEIVVIFLSVLMGFPVPLLPIHLLWVNLVTDSLPAVALGVDTWDKNIIFEKKENYKELGVRIVFEGCMIGALSLVAFGIGNTIFKSVDIGRTMSFCTLSISQLIHAFNMRSRKSLLSISIFDNMYLVGAMVLGIAMQWSVVQLDLVSDIFRTMPLEMTQWAIIMGLSLMPILICEIEKKVANS